MKDYYNLFVNLSLQQCTKNDYTNKFRVDAHNKATKKLICLQSEMKKEDCMDTLRMLLNHNDDRVVINAAATCLQMNILVNQAISALERIIDSSGDPTICLSAKMLLRQNKN